jgi:predicted XRE-type DNA-binding protein
MNMKKKKALEQRGWKIGDAGEFLGLTPEEKAYVELKLSLALYLQKKRQAKHITQEQLARLIHSSQSRVAKMEKSDSTISIDLLVKSLLALGASRSELSRAIT